MRLNTIKPAEGSKKPPSASAGASARAWARPPAAATRARSRVRAASTRSASRAARCRCSVAAEARLQVARAGDSVAEVRLSDLQKLPGDEVDLLALKAAGVVPADRQVGEGDPVGRAGAQGRAQGRRRDQGRQGGDRGGRRFGGLSGPDVAQGASELNVANESRPRSSKAASTATSSAGCGSCCSRWSSTGSGRTSRCRASTRISSPAVPAAAGRHPRAVQHVLGRRAVALHGLRAGDHAVHLGVDHHAAAARWWCRSSRPSRRKARPAGARSRSTRAGSRSALATFQALGICGRARGAAGPRHRPGAAVPVHRPRSRCHRHDVPDVAGRADHRARPGQRHLDHHLRGHRGGLPARSAAWASWCAPVR
jgi:large subunit ribosomal protein L15